MRLTFSHWLRAAAIAGLVALVLVTRHVQAAAGPQSGIDLTNLDRTCKPCTDFYQFADGGWIKKNPIPAAYPAFGNFQKLADRNTDVLHDILNQASAAHAKTGGNEQKIGDFYAACMDTAAIDAAGASPIQTDLALAGNADAKNIAATLAKLQNDGVSAFFAYGSSPDAKNSSMSIAEIDQDGLGLPDRDYYLNGDDRSVSLRKAYLAHVTQMFTLLGDSPSAAAAEAQSVMSTETALAKVQMSRVEMRDPANVYHKMQLTGVQQLAPALDLPAYIAAMRAPAGAPINVSQPAYVKAMSAQIAAMSPQDLHAYLRWHVVHAFAADLSKPFDDANFDFYGKTLQGSQEQLPRWKRCVRATDRTLGEALGQFYVAKTFPPAAKAQALAMVENIKQTFRDDLSTLEWMSPQTRARAVDKLDAFILKIGYPNKWRSYANLPIVRGSYAQNVLAANHFENARDVAKIGKPVNRMEWGMTPPTVNAYYNPSINEIVFPAGILQPPFFNKDADMAVNYGGIGAVIGHESTHGFDDEGRKFDKYGNLRDWWTAQDAARFTARAQCVVNQWNALSPEPGVTENGALIQGEEIADLGGMTIAYKAFEKWQAHHPRLTIDGFTPEQRFFLGWAQVWASAERPQYIAMLAKVDVHGYDKFRVNATLANMPGFQKAWFCKLTDAMVRPPNTRCQIW